MPDTKEPLRIEVKRAYDAPAGSDGCRILVDRIWPRGVSKGKARLDRWIKEVAPSTTLRKWFGHDPSKWDAFKEQYFRELDGHPDAVALLIDIARIDTITLVFSAKETCCNNAIALREYLQRHAKN